jgi:arginine N-succinyltransferase
MLSDSARSAIGVPHPSGRAAMRMLEEEGFSHEGYVDIFDGGPTMTARTSDVKSVREARPSAVAYANLDIGERAILATGTMGTFRSAFGMRDFRPDGSIEIDRLSAAALGVGDGDEVWSVAR